MFGLMESDGMEWMEWNIIMFRCLVLQKWNGMEYDGTRSI